MRTFFEGGQSGQSAANFLVGYKEGWRARERYEGDERPKGAPPRPILPEIIHERRSTGVMLGITVGVLAFFGLLALIGFLRFKAVVKLSDSLKMDETRDDVRQ